MNIYYEKEITLKWSLLYGEEGMLVAGSAYVYGTQSIIHPSSILYTLAMLVSCQRGELGQWLVYG